MAVAEAIGAIRYDIPGVEMSHVGGHCRFDAFLKKYDWIDPALEQLASIVRGADTSKLDHTPIGRAIRNIAGSVSDFQG
jgi:hypothetical protein